ncbi:hypothetical protein [Shewanella fodinae]|uniref:Competence protein CoiA-like protein n=1 Tax=Shewanella fodinae TaxID=552357 RepID=A0A4R2F4K6_9GAMM|nr:hypothetical protein [Shewanella fodinae]TCN76281.1 hypothetical protein EDC91_1584 [Shewanella fodinae]
MALLIPFGLLQPENKLVDVSSVTRGLACRCICPACSLPLVAKHSDNPDSDRAWHFAHHTADKSGKVNFTECHLSYYVSIRMMLRQILLADGLKIMTPAYSQLIDNVDTPLTKSAMLNGTITLDVTMNDQLFDAVVNLGNFQVAIYISHPERPCPVVVDDFSESIGVLDFEIPLMPLIQTVLVPNTREVISAESQLVTWVSDSVKGKQWKFHPRELLLRRKDEQARQAKAAALEKDRIEMQRRKDAVWRSNAQLALTERNELARCRCFDCDLEFNGKVGVINRCPNCGEFQRVWRIDSSSATASVSLPGKSRYKYKDR